MGTIEIVGYVGDGFIMCLQCVCKEYDEDRAEPFNFQGTFKDWLKSKGLKAVTDQEDFGSEGCYSDCGNAIQESYCPKCGNATGTFGDLCSNCEAKYEDEDLDETHLEEEIERASRS